MFFRTGAGAEGFLELAQALSFQVFRFEKRLPLSCAPRKGQRSAGPLPGAARHFAFSETGRAGHTQCVCCFAPEIRCAHFGAALANPALAGLRPSFRFQRNRAGRSHAARVLLRAQNSLRSFWGPARKPGTFRSAKKHKFQRQQLANLCFLAERNPPEFFATFLALRK